MKFNTLAMALATVSATNVVELDVSDMMDVKNFMKLDLIPAFIQGNINKVYKGFQGKEIFVKDGTKIQWAQCDDDKGVFSLDDDNTYADPDPPQKDADISLNLVGAVDGTINCDKVNVVCMWNGSQLYNDDKVGGTFTDSVEYQMKWNIPAIAPDGDYDITLKCIESDGATKDFCVNAKFSFQ